MAYPSTLTTLTNPNANDKLNSPSHSSIHSAENTAITELQTFVGTLASTAGTLIYDIRATASDGGGHVQGVNKGGTGQTAYTKGDLLVASSSSVLTKLAVGATDGQVLKVDSTKATGLTYGNAALGAPTVRVYTVSSTAQIWNKPSNLSFIIVELVGGGGAGGSKQNNQPCGGGGAGGYTIKTIPASSVGAAVSVLAGAGGVGSIMAVGTDGGLSYFGSLLSALGGQAGGPTAISNLAGGLGRGASILGDYEIIGGSGGVALITSVAGSYMPGFGGNSHLGGGAIACIAGNIQGNDAIGYGGGGSGAVPTQTSVRGGNGGNGVVIVYEY